MAVTHLATPVLPTTEPTAAAVPPSPAAVPGPPALAAGDKVEVRRRLDGAWARGFEVLAATDAGYRLRRLSDGVELPTVLPAADVRKERKRSTWWY